MNAACIGARPSPVRARISWALEFGKGAEHGEIARLAASWCRPGVGQRLEAGAGLGGYCSRPSNPAVQ